SRLMRSRMTSYPKTPSSFRYEISTGIASTRSPPLRLIASMRAHGNVSSMPNRSPTRFFRIWACEYRVFASIPSAARNQPRRREEAISQLVALTPPSARSLVNRMYREYGKWWSPSLGREMEFLWFGKCGRRVMLFLTSGGHFFEDEYFY